MRDTTNPWAEVGNQAVGALYKHYMSQPNQADLENARLQNTLLNARAGTEAAQAERLRTQTQLDQRRLDSANNIGNLVSSFYAPETIEGPRISPAQYGPMPSIEGDPRQETIDERIMSSRGDLMSNAANFAIASPGSFADVLSGFYSGAGAPQEMLAPMQDSSDLSSPVKNFEYRQGLTDPSLINIFDSYVRANQKLNLGDEQVLASGATGLPVQTYGQGLAPDRTVDTKGGRVIVSPSVSNPNRPVVSGDTGAQAVQTIAQNAGADPLQASQDAIQNRQNDIGSNPFQSDPAPVIQPDGTSITQLPPTQEDIERERNKSFSEGIYNDSLNNTFASALSNISRGGAGLTSIVKDVPVVGGQTTAGSLEADLSKITSKAAIGEIARLKSESKTGGFFGNLSDGERQAVADSQAALKQALRPEDLAYRLLTYQDTMNDIIHGRGKVIPGTNEVVPLDAVVPRTGVPKISDIQRATTPEEINQLWEAFGRYEVFNGQPPDFIADALADRLNEIRQ